MNAKDAIRRSIVSTDMIVDSYLNDMTDAELMVRSIPGVNHIAWQLGHLIASEHNLIEEVMPGSMPALPAGWAEKYTKETASIDDPKAFHTKAEYLRVMKEQRAGTLAALAKIPEADLEKPAPEAFRQYCPQVADVFLLQGPHYVMHAGQWAVTRRKLGRPPLF